MRRPPPSVTTSTPVLKAITMILQPHTKLLMVISSRTGYSSNKEDNMGEQVLGFITREAIFTASHALPFSLASPEDDPEQPGSEDRPETTSTL